MPIRHPNQADANEALAAFAANPSAKQAWHLHHEKLFETLTEPAANRIDYVLWQKPSNEVETRLRLFRPVRMPAASPTPASSSSASQLSALSNIRYYADILKGAKLASFASFLTALGSLEKEVKTPKPPDMNQLHREQCDPHCPWDGNTIFPPGKPRVNW